VSCHRATSIAARTGSASGPWYQGSRSSSAALHPVARSKLTAEDVLAAWHYAQELEELADSYGARDYSYADAQWQKARELAERFGGAQMMEQLSTQFGITTPAAREAMTEMPPQDLDFGGIGD
jgi:hypothetical protein